MKLKIVMLIAAIAGALSLSNVAFAQFRVEHFRYKEADDLANCLWRNYARDVVSIEPQRDIQVGEYLDISSWKKCKIADDYREYNAVPAKDVWTILKRQREDSFVACVYLDPRAKAAMRGFLDGDFTKLTPASFLKLKLPGAVLKRGKICDATFIDTIFGSDRYGRIIAYFHHRYRA